MLNSKGGNTEGTQTQGRERRRTADEKVEEKQRGTENEDREGKMNEEVGRRQKIERKGTASQ